MSETEDTSPMAAAGLWRERYLFCLYDSGKVREIRGDGYEISLHILKARGNAGISMRGIFERKIVSEAARGSAREWERSVFPAKL